MTTRRRLTPHVSLRFNLSFKLMFAAALLFTVCAGMTANAATLTISAGGDLQSALNAAQPGDEIVLDAGASFTGPFMLPEKGGADYITVRSSASASLAADKRVSPADAASMPKILSPGQGVSALQTNARAHHFRFIGIEFKPVDANAFVYDLVKFGDGSGTQNSLDQVPHHLILDRCYIHAYETQQLKRGVALNSASSEVINSYLAGFKVSGQDSQAIMGWNGPGPFRIVNNYLEGAAENVLFGGADPSIPNLVPSDIEVRNNYFFKPLAWRGAGYAVKNLFELKNAQRVVISGNVFENNWVDAQVGYAILFTVRNQDGTAPWSVVRDVQFTNNIVRHSSAAINILGRDNNHPSQQTKNIQIKNNLFDDIGGAWGGDGAFLKITASDAVTIDHNTVFQTGNTATAYGDPSTNFVFTNQLIAHNAYGVVGDSHGIGNDSLNFYFPSASFAGNAIVISAGDQSWRYPAGNSYPTTFDAVGFVNRAGSDYRLASNSAYKSLGTDGRDPGCDVDALNAAVASVGASVPAPTATPAATAPAPTAPAPVSPRAVASFVKMDSTTQGNWKGVYGADGYTIINDGARYPAYAQITPLNSLSWTWAASTSEARGLQKASATDRIAATWYEENRSFDIDVNFTDNQTHQMALYALDYDSKSRAQSIVLTDAATGAVLDTQSMTSFTQGQYLVWNINGHVKIKAVRASSSNAVVGGLFFQTVPAASAPVPTQSGVPVIFLANGGSNNAGAILNSGTSTFGHVNVTTAETLGADKRTRLMLFAMNISASTTSVASTTSYGDVQTQSGVLVNIADSVTVEARTTSGQVFRLPVEYAGAQGSNSSLDQVNIVLVPELQNAGSVQLTLIKNGQRSNSATIMVQ